MQSFVECVSGLMGGGKSFICVRRMCAHIAQGGVVYSNIQLKIDPWFNPDYAMSEFRRRVCPLLEKVGYVPECKHEFKDGRRVPVVVDDRKLGLCHVYNSVGAAWYLEKELKWRYQDGQFNYIADDLVGPRLPEHLPRGAVDRPVLVVLDEALDHFESESSNTNAEFRSFLRHVRKLGINLIFIAQDFGSLEKKIRVLTHYVHTCRDLKTWKVPVIGAVLPGGVLPPPWCDNIHWRQYHQKQFGMSKAEPVNRTQYVFRDMRVFGCYQSVSLHNSNIVMSGTAADFGNSGRILKKGGKVSKIERVLVYGLLCVSLWFSFRGRSAVASEPLPSIAAAASVSAGVPELAELEIEYLPISWISNGRSERVFIEGRPIVVGALTPRGIVEEISSGGVRFRSVSGADRWVIHQSPISEPEKEPSRHKRES